MNRPTATMLLDDYPILVYPTLAKAIGLNQAIILQQLHWLLGSVKTDQREYNFVEGRWWVYNSYPQWHEKYFIWLSQIQIKRIFIELEKDYHFVLSMQFVKHKSDARKWYTIDYPVWEQFATTIVSKRYDQPSYQNDTVMVSKWHDGYKETPEETIKKEKKKTPSHSRKKKPHKSWQQYTVGSAPPESDEPTENHRDEIEAALEGLRKLKHTSRRKGMRREHTTETT